MNYQKSKGIAERLLAQFRSQYLSFVHKTLLGRRGGTSPSLLYVNSYVEYAEDKQDAGWIIVIAVEQVNQDEEKGGWCFIPKDDYYGIVNRISIKYIYVNSTKKRGLYLL